LFFFAEATKAHNTKILILPTRIGWNIGGEMPKTQPNYHEDLLKRLKDPDYAADYIEAVLEEGDDPEAFLLALRDVAQARGMSHLARETNLQRENLYTMLSERGNPVLRSVYAILDALDMRLSIARKQPA
jgi:probable addiction module antidote protein